MAKDVLKMSLKEIEEASYQEHYDLIDYSLTYWEEENYEWFRELPEDEQYYALLDMIVENQELFDQELYLIDDKWKDAMVEKMGISIEEVEELPKYRSVLNTSKKGALRAAKAIIKDYHLDEEPFDEESSDED